MDRFRSSKRWIRFLFFLWVASRADNQQGQTECYDCNSKEVPKSFPVCTIRSTPSQPIHCIVWAKSYIFP